MKSQSFDQIMKLEILLLGLLLLQISTTSSVSTEFRDFYDFLEKFNSTSDKKGMIDSYITWQSTKGFPAIVNDTHAVFIYYTTLTVTSVAVAGDHNGWNPLLGPMTQLDPAYSFFYFAQDFESDARIDYKFVIGQNWILDPRNPSTVEGGFGPNSGLAMPDYIQPQEIIYNATIPHGTITTVSTNFKSSNPKLQVYLPPGYNTNREYKTVYFTDGSEYITLGSAVNVLDNLIASGEIEPLIGVFADPSGARHVFYDCKSPSYLDYIQELVEYIDASYSTNATREGRMHIGDSLGGLMSIYVGINMATTFKNIASHSGAFWDGGSSLGEIGCGIKKQFNQTSVSPELNMWYSAGSYEEIIFNDTILMEKYTNAKCWNVRAIYLHEGHSWGSWRATLDDALKYLMGQELPKRICGQSNSAQTSSSMTTSETEGNTDIIPNSTSNNTFYPSSFLFLFPFLRRFRRK